MTRLRELKVRRGRYINTAAGNFRSFRLADACLIICRGVTRIERQKAAFISTHARTTVSTTSALRVFRTLSMENVYNNISLVDQCNSLQNDLGVDSVLQQCLAEPIIASAIVRSEKTRILEQDWATTLEVAKQHQSLRYIVCSDSVAASWCRLWAKP